MDYYSSLNSSSLDPDTPTLFELLSSHQLESLISPSIRYILVHYAQHNPRYLLKLVHWFDEIYAALLGGVEYYHLKNWNAGFMEKFNGLKRTQVLNPILSAGRTQMNVPSLVNDSRRLTRSQIIGSLLCMVGGPYIKEKLTVRYESLTGKYLGKDLEEERARVWSTGSLSKQAKLQFEIDYRFLKLYSVVNFSFSTVSLVFSLFYLFSKTPFHSISDYLLGIKFSRMTAYDYILDRKRSELASPSAGDSFPRKASSHIRNGVLNVLDGLLPSSIFLLKFLEWWYSSDYIKRLYKKTRRIATIRNGQSQSPQPEDDIVNDDNLPVPKRSKMIMPLKYNIEDSSEDSSENDNENESESNELHERKSKSDKNQRHDSKIEPLLPHLISTALCTLCAKVITNPTIIETGTVFCYPCIFNHLKENGNYCPKTGQELLLCRWNDENEEWDVGGLRRLII
ncbi:hypothetical protein NADFUDRAFT_51638 [Nadsonia fulvescens var. elongata DSM 6958]|uniref:Peroxisome assembly protein 12 n=1 Tax=Nadsonia fulvescens var. elongata DSM 6958 TaxID=857566 RepID=A0A1E3PI04_9ASCO|nr:hypothetical protein NADFUDRAFT_51638 [Nadsonia fulvescens var. elongata DSM 6958]